MLIEFVYEGERGRVVEVAGDFPDFRRPHRMHEVEPGRYRVALELDVGVYRYKFLVDNNWILDPRNRRVDASEGIENNILVVDGLEPPICFAPDRRHLGIVGDHVEVRFEVDGDKPVEVEGAVVDEFRRGHRRFVRARLPLDAKQVRIDGRTFPIVKPHDIDRAPSWLDGAVIYGIFVDRWVRGRDSPPERRMLKPTTPSTPHCFYGGDLDGIRESLDYIARLGVDAIALTPLHVSESPHHYDARDLLAIDERLGGERALRELLEHAHARKLKVIVDVSLTHVHEKHRAFQDVLEKQQASPYAGWFRIKKFPVIARNRDTVELYYNCSDQPWLHLDDADCRNHALACVEKYVELGVDGLRLDAMDNAPASFWRDVRALVKQKNADCVLLGEVVHDALWSVAEARGVDVVTDFRMRDAFVAFFAKRTMDAAAFVDALRFAKHRTGAFASSYRLGFLDNHDTARFLSLARNEPRLRAAIATLLFVDETAWITYGTEAHLAAYTGERVLDSSWPERKAMPDPSTVTNETVDVIRAFCDVRKRVRAHELEVVRAHGSRLVLRRGEVVVEVDADSGSISVRPQ